MGDLRRPLLRPARAARGLRPPARGGGAPARRLIAAAALALWLAGAGVAQADTLGVDAYRARLRDARELLRTGRTDAARELLSRTSAIRVGDTLVAVDDRAAASPAAIDRRLAALDRAAASPDDAAAADARLRALLRDRGTAAQQGTFLAVIVAIAERLYELVGSPSPRVLRPAAVLAGLALAVAIVLILARGARERIRREVVLPELGEEQAVQPERRLAEAERAIVQGDVRGAIHAYYRFALETLASREAFAYDPALTDRELLARAAAVPHVDALRELVALHERVWFGLRPGDRAESARARTLAERVTA